MKIKLKTGETEVTRGDHLKAYFEGHGYGLMRIQDIRPREIKVHWIRNDWAKPTNGWMSIDWWENWELDEASVVKRLLSEYQA